MAHPGSRAAEQGGHPLGGGQYTAVCPDTQPASRAKRIPRTTASSRYPPPEPADPEPADPEPADPEPAGAAATGTARALAAPALSGRRAAPSGRGQRTAGLLAEPHSLAVVADPPEVREGEVVPGIQHDRHARSGPLRAARTRCSGSLTGGAGRRPAASSARLASPASSAMAPSRHSAAAASRR